MVAIGVFGMGALVFTTLVNVAVPIMMGTLRAKGAPAVPAGAEMGH
jgi:hypothetical protein